MLDKVGNKTAIKEERQRGKKASPDFGLCACMKNKKLFNDVRLVEKNLPF